MTISVGDTVDYYVNGRLRIYRGVITRAADATTNCYQLLVTRVYDQSYYYPSEALTVGERRSAFFTCVVMVSPLELLAECAE